MSLLLHYKTPDRNFVKSQETYLTLPTNDINLVFVQT